MDGEGLGGFWDSYRIAGPARPARADLWDSVYAVVGPDGAMERDSYSNERGMHPTPDYEATVCTWLRAANERGDLVVVVNYHS